MGILSKLMISAAVGMGIGAIKIHAEDVPVAPEKQDTVLASLDGNFTKAYARQIFPKAAQLTGRYYLQFTDVATPLSGQVEYCKRVPEDCKFRTEKPSVPFHLTEEMYWKIVSVNSFSNETILPRYDIENYGTNEYWTVPAMNRDYSPMTGDCDDYVLDKRERLRDMGIPDSAMSIVLVKTEYPAPNNYHVVLAIHTHEGDYILDNLTEKMLFPFETGYEFVKATEFNDFKSWKNLAPVMYIPPEPESITAAAEPALSP